MEENTALRQARISRGWRQVDLAHLLAVHRSTVIRWEHGTIPEVFWQEKLCALFGMSGVDLGFSPSPNSTTADPVSNIYWNIPCPRNPFFTGREEELVRLHEAFMHDRNALISQSLSGLGGIGKTQTAIEYAYRYGKDYIAVFWISAETNEGIVFSFVAIAELLNLPERHDKEQDHVLAAVLRWLTSHSGWLVIFDNVEDLELVKSFLPPARCGSLLFTSRRQAVEFSAYTLNLKQMTTEEGVRFLLHRTRLLASTVPLNVLIQNDLALATEIVAAMDGLPLALDQAGAYIEATKCSLSKYLQLFQFSQLRLLDERATHADHPSSVTRTFALAFEQLEQSNPAAAELLTVCAFLAPEAIPETFFIEGASYLGTIFEILATDPLAFQDAFKALLAYSLIQRNAATKMVTIHRLVQAVLKGRLSKDAQQEWVTHVLHAMARLFPGDPLSSMYMQRSEELLPHALLCLTLSQVGQEASCISLMNHVATYFLERVRFAEAEALYERALHIGKPIMEKEHPLVAETLYGLAQFHFVQGQFEKAEPLYQQALHIFEETLGSETPQVAQMLNKLGVLYLEQGQFEKAEPLYQQAVHIFECTLGFEHPQTANSWNGLGAFYLRMGQFEQAEPLFQRALHIFEEVLGFEHPRVASIFNNLAVIYFFQGRYEEAEPLYQRSAHIWEIILGPKHPQVAMAQSNIGYLYLEQDMYEKAESYYRQAVHIFEEALGFENISIVLALSGLADSLREQRKYDQAELLYNRCLRIVELTSSFDYPPAIDPLLGLATLFKVQGKYEEAEPLYHRALAIAQKNAGSQSWEFAYLLHCLAQFHHIQGQYKEASTLYQQALTIFEQTLGLEHPKAKRVKKDIASLRFSESDRPGSSPQQSE